MKLSFLGQSGYLVELENNVLIFDYFKGKLPDFDRKKNVWVFISHAHRDHYNDKVFTLLEGCPHQNLVASDDIEPLVVGRIRSGRLKFETVMFLEPHSQAEVNGLEVETLKSTDEGVAFYIKIEGKTLFHAGDLNLWLWDENTEEENAEQERIFGEEMQLIAGRKIDLAFFPVDPRLRSSYQSGIDAFMRATETAEVYPMHFWGKFSIVNKLIKLPCTEPYRDAIRMPEQIRQ